MRNMTLEQMQLAFMVVTIAWFVLSIVLAVYTWWHFPKGPTHMTARRLIAGMLVAVVFSVTVHSLADDLLRAVCAGIGPDNPLYDYLGCSALEHNAPEG